VLMEASEQTTGHSTEPPRPVKVGLWVGVGLLLLGAAYLYAVRGTAILLDLSSGIAGLLCL